MSSYNELDYKTARRNDKQFLNSITDEELEKLKNYCQCSNCRYDRKKDKEKKEGKIKESGFFIKVIKFICPIGHLYSCPCCIRCLKAGRKYVEKWGISAAMEAYEKDNAF